MELPILHAVYNPVHLYACLLYLVAHVSLLTLNHATRLIVTRSLGMNRIVPMTILGVMTNIAFSENLKLLNSLERFDIVALIITKSLISLILTHFLVDQMSIIFDGSTDPGLSNFGFLYGTSPTTLGVDSHAGQYHVSPDLISAAIIICTAFSAPLMYVSANILTILDTSQEEYLSSLMTFEFDICLFSIIGAVLIILIFIISKRCLQMPHSLTTSVIFFSIQTSCGGLVWSCGLTYKIGIHYAKVI